MNTSELLELLSTVVDPSKIHTGADIGADYCHDELTGGKMFSPDAVVDAVSTEQVSALLRVCSSSNIPVTVRGAGTGQAGGSVPVNGGIVLSMKGMNKIISFNEAEKTLTLQPGVLLKDVISEASSHGLYYPPDPGEKTATIGGNAATNAAGPCAFKYGKTRDYIVDALIVLSDGTTARLSDSGDYAAVIGSEGTLAVITEITLRLAEKPGADITLLFPYPDIESALGSVPLIKASELAPCISIIEYMDTDMVEFSGNVTGNPMFPIETDGERVAATVMVTIEGEDDDDVESKMEAIAEMSEDFGCLDILVVDSLSMKREVWAAHDAFHTSIESGAKCSCEVNVDIPTEAIFEFTEAAKAIGESLGLKALIYSHAGSGGVHVHAVSDEAKDDFLPKAADFSSLLYSKCAEVGGCIKGEYGIGYSKNSEFRKFCPDEYAAHTAAKEKLDPKGILNPGKLLGGEEKAQKSEIVYAADTKTAVKEKPSGEIKESADTAPAGNLKILVCVKQVPDVDQMRMDPETGLLVRAGVPAILNPQDANALSAAMKVKETYGAEITLITMGPPNAEAALRECLAVGADKAVLVTDRAFGNADTLATSYSIKSAADTVGSFDMIFCGKESLDGATGQMGAQLAQRFGTAQVTSALLIRAVDEAGGTVTVDRELEKGIETLRVKLPCLFTMEKTNYPPRIPNLKGKMAAKKAEIITVTSNDIPGLDRGRIGDPGSPTKVPRMFPPVMPEPGVILDEGSVKANVGKLFELIQD